MKICIIEVYLLRINFKAISLINEAIKDKQTIKYYGILRRYNWSMLQIRNFMKNVYDAA